MEEFLKIVGLLGIGGIVGSIVNHILLRRADSESNLYKVREERYRNILGHMSTLLNPTYTKFMDHADPQTGNQFAVEDHKDFLNAEYYHSCLYAPDPVLKKLKAFIEGPTEDAFIAVAISMRKDLWKKKSNLADEEIKLANQALQTPSARHDV